MCALLCVALINFEPTWCWCQIVREFHARTSVVGQRAYVSILAHECSTGKRAYRNRHSDSFLRPEYVMLSRCVAGVLDRNAKQIETLSGIENPHVRLALCHDRFISIAKLRCRVGVHVDCVGISLRELLYGSRSETTTFESFETMPHIACPGGSVLTIDV